MSARATATEPASAADRATVDTGYLGRVLDILINIGTAIAGAVLQQTQAGPDSMFLDGSAVYVRVFRAVRRMIMLAMAIDAPGYGEPTDTRVAREGVERESEEPMERPEGEEAKERPERLDRLDIRYTLKNKTMDQLIQGGLP